MTEHNALHTIGDSELHEDKGVASANDREIFFSDGAQSGGWHPLLETAGSWTYSTDVAEIEFTGLDEYCMLQVDLVGITLGSASDQYIGAVLGNDGGYTTSSNYFDIWWGSAANGSNSKTFLPLLYFRDNAPFNSHLNISSALICNFNTPRYTIAHSQYVGLSTTGNVLDFRSSTHWVRETVAYNKVKFITEISDFTGGSIVVSGYRYGA